MGFYLPVLYNTMLKASLGFLKNKNKAFSVLLLTLMHRQLQELCEVNWFLIAHFKDISMLIYV